MRQIAFLFVLLISAITSFSQKPTNEEMKLYNLIMEYRKTKGLPGIPISPSLTIVAQTHIKDLQENHPEQDPCNLHSWSDKGNWTPCCYTSDHAKAQCMWDKPKELTSYQSYGFEIATWGSGKANAEEALDSWKNSSGHNDVIINQGIWNDYTWKAIGIGMSDNYAVVWFGLLEDKEIITSESTVPDMENPVFALMTCGNTTFMFQTFSSMGSELPEIKRQDGGSLLLYIKLKDIRTFYSRIKDKVKVIKELDKTFYGATEFSITDNNGYVLTFAEESN
jgi:uncharacterized glyoxalase superfamily protein PhnB